MVEWIIANQNVVIPLAVALLDLLFAVNPNTQSSGFLHACYVFLGGKKGLPEVPPAPPK